MEKNNEGSTSNTVVAAIFWIILAGYSNVFQKIAVNEMAAPPHDHRHLHQPHDPPEAPSFAHLASLSLLQTSLMGLAGVLLCLLILRYDVLLCLQFFRWLRASPGRSSPSPSPSIEPEGPSAEDAGPMESNWRTPFLLIIFASVTDFVGTFATNLGTAHGSVAFLHSVKSTEPLFVFLFGLLSGVSGFDKLFKFSTLAPVTTILLGVYLTSVSSSQHAAAAASTFYSLASLVWALVANTTLAIRVVSIKLLATELANCSSGDTAAILSNRSPLIMVTLSLFTGTASLAALFLCQFSSEAPPLTWPSGFVSWSLIAAVTHALYRISSNFVVTHLSLISHTILNMSKRAFIVILASSWFNTHLSPTNWFGVALILCGVTVFEVLRAREDHK